MMWIVNPRNKISTMKWTLWNRTLWNKEDFVTYKGVLDNSVSKPY